MNYQNTTQAYMRTAAKVGVRRQTYRRTMSLEIPGGLVLWKVVGKTVLLILPVVLVMQIFLASAINNIERSVTLVQQQQQELEDQNIELLARKARLWAPGSVERLAADKLALYSPSKKQIGTFNRRYATFSYL
jgi:hypothetical protein